MELLPENGLDFDESYKKGLEYLHGVNGVMKDMTHALAYIRDSARQGY